MPESEPDAPCGPSIANGPRRVYLHLENICVRRGLDIERIRRYLVRNGHTIAASPNEADCILLFGCAFNRHTEEQSLARVRDLRDSCRDMFVLEGIADTQGERLAQQERINPSQIIRCHEFDRLDRFFARHHKLSEIGAANDVYRSWRRNDLPLDGPANRDRRLFVQVGRGCSDKCTYCGDKRIVKDLVSKPLNECLEGILQGLAQGNTHVELIGDDVGAYGIDLGLTIIDLLQAILALPGKFTLSMQEVNIKYLIAHMKSLDCLLSHGRLQSLVVAFQSGNDRILRMMNRGYTRAQLDELLALLTRHNLRKRFHALVGFPTETNEEFRNTLDVIVESCFDSGSLFRYQDREYAPAMQIHPKISEQEKDARMQEALRVLQPLFHCEPRPDKLMVDQQDRRN